MKQELVWLCSLKKKMELYQGKACHINMAFHALPATEHPYIRSNNASQNGEDASKRIAETIKNGEFTYLIGHSEHVLYKAVTISRKLDV